MNIILKKAKIIDSRSNYHNQVVDIKIEKGTITEIAKNIKSEKGFDIIEHENLHVSEGWFDSSVSFGEPGFEERETIKNGLDTASKSGFTAVALNPNTNPILDNQALINFVKQKANGHTTKLYPIAAMTKNSDTHNLAELFDMKNAGAVAFGDYKKSIENANVLKLALQYVQDFDGLVIAFSQDKNIKGSGIANEGETSTKLGMKGIPNLSEDLQIARNLLLLEYTGGRLHIPTISTKKSVELIKEAKAKRLNVTCSVAAHNLFFTDEVLEGFDSNYKVNPPIRTKEDAQALVKGVKNGTIDMITSDHNPLDIEHKKLEFDKATDGVIGLESAFGALNSILPLEIIIEKLTLPKSIFGIKNHPIEIGQKADLTLFDPDVSYTFSEKNIFSKSENTPFVGKELKGIVYRVIVG
ncbi:MAG: dihydroorotase family protein [Flavobacteriaceae bacterium]